MIANDVDSSLNPVNLTIDPWPEDAMQTYEYDSVAWVREHARLLRAGQFEYLKGEEIDAYE